MSSPAGAGHALLPEETGRKSVCCGSKMVITKAGAKQEEPEKHFLNPIQQLEKNAWAGSKSFRSTDDKQAQEASVDLRTGHLR